MIKPTVGRIVLYRADLTAMEPYAAIVTRVAAHQTTHVDLTVFPPLAAPVPYASVRLVQDGEQPPEVGHWCEWMPYQKGQAAKTEQLEQALKDGFTKP